MKNLLLLLFVISYSVNALCQDVIYKNDGTEINAKVIEITTNAIKYKKYEQQNGPIRNISIDNVFMVIYEDGTKEVFKKKSITKTIEPQQKTDLQKNQIENIPISEPEQTITNNSTVEDKESSGIKLNFGIKGGVNISNIKVEKPEEDPEFLDFNSRLGFNLGIFASISLNKSLTIQTEINYSQKGAKHEYKGHVVMDNFDIYDGINKGTLKLDYIELPILFKINVIPNTNNKINLNLFIGPAISFNIIAKEKTTFEGEFLGEHITNVDTYNFEKGSIANDFSLLSGIDIKTKKIIFGVRYNMGLTNMVKNADDGDGYLKNNVMQINIGYIF